MPNAMMHHMTTCVALAFCSLPKAVSIGYRHPRTRGGRLASPHSTLRATAVPAVTALAGGADGGLVPPADGGLVPPAGGGGGSGGRGPDDSGDSGESLPSAFFAWLVGDQYRRAAIAGASWLTAVTWSVRLAQREADKPSGLELGGRGAADKFGRCGTPAAFSGQWVLCGSENFDEYLTSMGVSSLHRRYACSASVSQTIQSCVEGGSPVLHVCVRNQLGTRCEKCTMDGKPIRSVDVRGADIIKVFSVDAPHGPAQRAPVCVTEVRHSRNGVMYERRYLAPDGLMVMELTSPSGVVARRIFKKAPDAPPRAASAALAV